MTALAADKNIVFEYDDENTLPVAASTKIYKSAAVGDNGSGYARPLQAGDPFLGFALAQVDNSTGAAGAKDVNVKPKDRAVLNVTGVDGTDDIGKAVYASDDNTYTLTEGTNSFIGRVIRHESGTRCVVKFDATRAGFANLGTLLTDSSGGSASTTLAAIASGTPADLAAQGVLNGVIRNAIASLAAQIIDIQKRLA